MPFGQDDGIRPTPRTTVRRADQRASYDRTTIYRILDEALICHIGFIDDGQPYVIPMNHVRVGDRLCVHGSPASRILKRLSAGADASITVTLLDGLVLARSAMHHSLNYRSVVILARGEPVQDRQEKERVLQALVEHVVPGRWEDVRKPTERELAATAIVSFPLDEASAKLRSGPPVDDEDDYSRAVWAGVIPVGLTHSAPVPDPRLPTSIDVPTYAAAYNRPTWRD